MLRAINDDIENYFYKLAYFSTYLCFVMLLAHNLKIYTKSQSQTPENTASTAGWNDFVVGVRTKSYEMLPIQDDHRRRRGDSKFPGFLS